VSQSLLIKSRPGGKKVEVRQLRKAACMLLEELLGIAHFDLAIYLVRPVEMTRINQKFLGHEGSTDVITFDYADAPGSVVHGEIFICVDEAVSQARRFRTTWTHELVRYFIHGVLHLLGYDDVRPAARRKMKREENRLLKEMARRLSLAKIGVQSKAK
jgi:rRNA maturation RNase YbeY